MIRIIKSLENSSLLIHGVTETVKNEMKKQEGEGLASLMVFMTASLIVPVPSSLLGGIFGNGHNKTENKRKYVELFF